MSYILDALRRADAERERGAVPNIHAQPYAAPSNEADAPRATPPWLWIALALLAIAVLALGWKLFAGEAPREPVQVAAAPAAVPPLQTPAPTAVPTPSPVPLQPVQALPVTPPVPASRAAAAAPSKAASKPAARAEPASPATPATSPATAVAAPASAPANAAERIYAVSELPDDVRRSLPSLPIGGAMYSKNAADRMLIIGGQVMHEGDTVAPELKLEQIRLKSAVFRFKAYRYEVSY